MLEERNDDRAEDQRSFSMTLQDLALALSNWSPGRQLASIKTFSLVTLSF